MDSAPGRDTAITLGDLRLKHGGTLRRPRIAATLYGCDPQHAPTILVCHALTGNSRVAEWWPDILGPGRLLDTARFCVACTNVIGSCYGSTGPSGPEQPALGEGFPVVTVEDMVSAQQQALASLGVERLFLVIGASLGGQQALQWGAAFPDAVAGIVCIGATGRLSPLGIALNTIARQAITIDPRQGLKVARMIGVLSYQSAAYLWRRHARRHNRGEDPAESLWARFDVEGYLQHQGEKLAARMDPVSYVVLSKAMDLYELDPAGWRVPALLVGVGSDWLYPPEEVAATARELGLRARFALLASEHGHDGFLSDPGQLASVVAPFLAERVVRT